MQIARFCFPHKTASMFAHKMALELSNAFGYKYFSPNNIPANQNELLPFLREGKKGGWVFSGPSRAYDISPALGSAVLECGHELKSVCQLRNPLDVIVSQYFSHGWIHPSHRFPENSMEVKRAIQAGSLSIFDYAAMDLENRNHFAGQSLLEKLKVLETAPKVGNRVIVTYEDFYTHYNLWIGKVCEFLGFGDKEREILAQLKPDYSKVRVIEDGSFFEDPLDYVREFQIEKGKHFRSAVPGDYKYFFTTGEQKKLFDLFREHCPQVMSYYSV